MSADSGQILVQVVPSAESGGYLSGQTVTEKLADRVDELGRSLADVANQLRGSLERDLHAGDGLWRLSELNIQFSLSLEAEAGVVLARAQTTAGFQASLTWARRSGAE
jgi:hypothetical protein